MLTKEFCMLTKKGNEYKLVGIPLNILMTELLEKFCPRGQSL